MMDCIPAQPEHIPLIREAFHQERETRRNHYVAYLADPAIADFHRDRIIQILQNPANDSSLRLILENGRLMALAGLARSPWHSEHYGIPFYKINPFFAFASEPNQLPPILGAIRDTLCNKPGSVYAMRLEARQTALVYHMGRFGFAHVGVSLRMVMEPLPKPSVDNRSGRTYDFINIRAFKTDEIPVLEKIAERSHTHNHFFREVRFSKERTQALFVEWIRKCTSGWAQNVFVAESKGKVVGFSILLINRSLAPYIGKKIGIVDFIVVDRSAQGTGIGGCLLNASLAWFQTQAEVVELRTMDDNIEAVRFYEKHGFRVLTVDHHYHYWT